MVVLGGVSIFGGEGTMTGVVLAVLMLGVLRQGMLIAGFSDMVTTMVTGAILLAAIAIRNLLSGRGTGIALLFLRLRRLGGGKVPEAAE
jgi:ribose/xylose/arabinose/galactoside ABC-type transport system permease subunit